MPNIGHTEPPKTTKTSLSRFSAGYLCYSFVEEGPVWLR